jgi:hypothetical protein
MAITKITHHATLKQWKTLILFELGLSSFIFHSIFLLEYVVEECAKDLVDSKYLIIYIEYLIFTGILSV